MWVGFVFDSFLFFDYYWPVVNRKMATLFECGRIDEIDELRFGQFR